MSGTRRLAAFFTALILLALSIWVLVEVGLAISGEAGWLVDRRALDVSLREVEWTLDAAGWLIWGLFALLGLLLIGAGLLPGRPEEFAIAEGTAPGRETIDRRGIEQRLRYHIASDPDVDTVKARVGRRRVRLVVTPFSDVEEKPLRRRLRDTAETLLEELEMKKRLRPSVSVGRPTRRAR